jgi:hypothetical protein
MNKIPKDFQPILWSVDISKLDLSKNKRYVIHQILAYGAWKHLKWLFTNYKFNEIRKVFIDYPAKDYNEKNFNFIQKIVLNLPIGMVDKRYYVSTYPRIIG